MRTPRLRRINTAMLATCSTQEGTISQRSPTHLPTHPAFRLVLKISPMRTVHTSPVTSTTSPTAAATTARAMPHLTKMDRLIMMHRHPTSKQRQQRSSLERSARFAGDQESTCGWKAFMHRAAASGSFFSPGRTQQIPQPTRPSAAIKPVSACLL